MATIGKITSAKSGTAAIEYAIGKDRMPEETKSWLIDQGLDPQFVNDLKDRAVVMDGLNVDPQFAKTQMKATRYAFKTRGIECTRIIQSFSTEDLNPASKSDWKEANKIGLELAKKAFPEYQVAIYTHVDGEGHKLHNHIILNMPNLKTGKKYHEHQNWRRIAEISNKICLDHNLSIIDKKNRPPEKRTIAEIKRAKKGDYVWKDDLRSRIDKAMLSESKESLRLRLQPVGVELVLRGNNITYSFTDKEGKKRKARGTTLGHDYEKETLRDELERQFKQSETAGRKQQSGKYPGRVQQGNRERTDHRGLHVSEKTKGTSRDNTTDSNTRTKVNDPRGVHRDIEETDQFIENAGKQITEIARISETLPGKQRSLGRKMGRGDRASIKLGEKLRKFRINVKEFAKKVREELKLRLQREQEKKNIEELLQRIYRPKPRGRGR